MIVSAVTAFALAAGAPGVAAQQPGTEPPRPGAPAAPAAPGTPPQPETPVEGQRPPGPAEEAPPPPAEAPAAELPPVVPEEVTPSGQFGLRVPTFTIGDTSLFLPPLPRGRLQITPSITLSGEWTDNIDDDPDDREDEITLSIIPGITLRARQPKYELLAGYYTAADFHLKDTEDDAFGDRHRLFANFFYQYDPRLSFRVGERFVYDRDTESVTVSGISTGRRQDAYRNTLTPSVRWQATPLTGVEVLASYTLLRFDEEDGVDDDQDSDTYRVVLAADHRFTQRLTGTADFGFAYFNFEEDPEAYTYTPRIGLAYDFTPRLRGFISGGAAFLKQRDEFGVTPAGSIGLSHRYQWGTVAVGYDRGIVAEGDGATDRQTLFATVRVLTLMRGLNVEFLGRYTMTDTETEGRTDENRDVLSLELRGVYQLTATVSVIASYRFFDQTSDRSANEFDRSRVFLGLQYAYPINLD